MNPKTSALFEKSTQEKKSAVPNCYLQAADPFFHALPDSEKNKICSSVCPADGEKSKETTVKIVRAATISFSLCRSRFHLSTADLVFIRSHSSTVFLLSYVLFSQTPTAKKDWIFQEGIFDEFSLPGQKRQAYTEVLNRKNREYVIESLVRISLLFFLYFVGILLSSHSLPLLITSIPSPKYPTCHRLHFFLHPSLLMANMFSL